MRYLLDSNAIIALLNDKESYLGRQVRKHKPSDIAVSAIVICELFYGAFKSHNTKEFECVPGLQIEDWQNPPRVPQV